MLSVEGNLTVVATSNERCAEDEVDAGFEGEHDKVELLRVPADVNRRVAFVGTIVSLAVADANPEGPARTSAKLESVVTVNDTLGDETG